MPPESNGPNINLPSSGDLADFLDGNDATDQGDALDTMAQAEQAAEIEELEESDEPEPQGDVFDRNYVEKLRRQNAAYRNRAKKWESAFEGYEEGAVEEWKQMISTFKNDPKSVAEQWKGISEQILQQFTPQEQAEIAEAVADGEEMPLTRSEFDKLISEKEQKWEIESLVQDIEHEAQELGYNLKSREYKILLMTAQEIPSGSIAEAHALLEGERQKYFDSRIEELEKQGGGYKSPSNKVGVPDTTKTIKDFKDAKAALSNYLDANFR